MIINDYFITIEKMNFLVIVIKCNSITKSNMDKKVLTVSELNTIIYYKDQKQAIVKPSYQSSL